MARKRSVARMACMKISGSFEGSVGNTPLIRLSRLSEETGCEILGKAEFLNPGGSVKDRAALWIIREHEKSGALKPGGTVVEGTAGNTGIGLVHICNARGYSSIIYMPDNQSPEKVELLRTLGAEVRVVPTRRGVGQPVRQRRQSDGALRIHRSGGLGPDR